MKNFKRGNTGFVLFGLVALAVVAVVAYQVYNTGDKSEDVIIKSRDRNANLLNEINNADNPNAGMEQ